MNVFGSVLSSGVGGVDYSTSEQDTGIKWIDGSKLYQRTYTGTLSSSEITTIASIGSYKVKNIEGYYYSSSSGYTHRTPALVVASGTVYYACAYVESTNLKVQTNALQGYSYYLTITYTK